MKCAVVYTFSLLLRTSAFSHSPPSNFIGNQVLQHYPQNGSSLTMRKQKASDKRTSRMQKNLDIESATTSLEIGSATSTLSPLKIRDLQEKYVFTKNQFESSTSRGRGRSRKRSAVYNNLASYRNHFLELLTQEFTAEVSDATVSDGTARVAIGLIFDVKFPFVVIGRQAAEIPGISALGVCSCFSRHGDYYFLSRAIFYL